MPAPQEPTLVQSNELPAPMRATATAATTAPYSYSALEIAENKIRSHVLSQRIRVSDLFADFDRLRTGYVSASQFRRGVGAAMGKGHVGVPVTPEEYEILLKAYAGTGEKEGRVKWTAFVDSIDKVFGAKKLESTPTQYVAAPHEVVKPVRPPLSPENEKVLQEVIERLRQYVKHHGSDVKSWFKDFDKHNNGYITYNQFRRGIPSNLMSEEEEELLVLHYCDTVTNTVNYFKMNTDVNRKVRRVTADHVKLVAKHSPDHIGDEHVPIGTEELLHAVGKYLPVDAPLDKVETIIKKQVYKERIRLIEFFKDYDRHNCGQISEAQFRAGIRQSELRVDQSQLTQVISSYKEKNGLVNYRRFCNSIDEVFTTRDLEKNPLAEVKPPPRHFLVDGANELPPNEEARCRELIQRFRQLIRERRLLLAPYFKDYDKCLTFGNIGCVTRSHFSRLLSTMKLDVSDNDLHILFKKFEDREHAKVDYMEFIRVIDPETYGSSTPQQKSASSSNAAEESLEAAAGDAPNAHQILDRIRTTAASQRIRVSEFFKDFDKLRSYSIPRQEFIRGVNRIGLCLTEREYDVLADLFVDKDKSGCCCWKDFEENIERAFNDSSLERHPTKVPTLAPVQTDPFPTTMTLTSQESAILEKTLSSIAAHMRVRQTHIKRFFKDFDKLCTGHVTKVQFRQCLTYLQVSVSDAEFEVMCKRWREATESSDGSDKNKRTVDPIKDGAERICYMKFLVELDRLTSDEPQRETAPPVSTTKQIAGSVKTPTGIDVPAGLSATGKKNVEATSGSGHHVVEPLSQEQISHLLTKIKTKARTERVRVIDFMQDFDNLKHGKITKNEFRRALKVIFLDLTESELVALETTYACTTEPSCVNYVKFSDEVESVFTIKELEKNPTVEPTPFVGYLNGADPALNKLDAKEEKILEKVISRLREKILQRRVDILSYMEDFDFVKEGTITTNQFRSVLCTNNLSVDDKEIRVLAKRFTIDKNLDRINYRAFANAVSAKKGTAISTKEAGVGMVRYDAKHKFAVNTFGIW